MLKSKFWLFLVIALSSTAALAMEDQGADDFVKGRARLRKRDYWDELKSNRRSFELRTFSTDSDENYVIRRLSIDRKFENTIRYNVTLPEFLITDEQNYKPRGVIIKVYGGGIKEELQENYLSEEHIYASQGYIVYSLNLRGTEDYGETYVNDLRAAHGVQSLVRDITYFANLIKTGSGDIDGQKPAFARLVKPEDNLPI
ncbi:MAG TPA: hypothetical protein VMW10_07960, partial [Alphaproteobacteria bacterium]|nr:hypothetical protein [Alphaproteobacteria bacterium]